MRSPPLRRETTCEKHDLVQSGKNSLKSWPDVKLIPQTNKQTLVKNRSSVAPADRKRRQLGEPSTDQEDLLVRFLVAAGPSYTKDGKNGSGPCLHGTHDEVGTTQYNWLARCQYNLTGWFSMWADDMLSK